MKPSIAINGENFVLVKIQRDNESAIYKGADTFLRLGEKGRIIQELAIHKRMEELSFPVARLLKEGEYEGQLYFIETSLGAEHYGELFARDVKKYGRISDERFEDFLAIMKRFARAQVSTCGEQRDEDRFADSIHMPMLLDEFPDLAPRIQKYYIEAMKKLALFPFCLTHGDCNPHNIHTGGIIDLEVASSGPIGYDLISALVTVDYFPSVPGYEFITGYQFTDKQKQRYLEVIDSVFAEAGLPPVSQYTHEFEFCRAVWLLVRMHKWPKLRQFRYDIFMKKFLNA
ncbi:MAG: aminoglycoside phosphotransferase family protein [Candidatus Moranbacteria bacterium]|nr:aminoglycoside phosphotransferase family protein [Candidatus Moranbacteria bacterium]